MLLINHFPLPDYLIDAFKLHEQFNIHKTTNMNATFSGFFASSDFTDEEKASGFIDSKAQRERFAEYCDFSATNTSIRDEETGFGYFGARYMEHELMTMWLSVDPLADKYPGTSPYAYCAWNPIVYTDSNGMEFTNWPMVGRCVKGALNIASGALTAMGGIVIGAGGSIITGGAAAPVGAFVVGTGAYEIVEGIHTITNALSGAPQSSDPQYATPLGAATDNAAVDVFTSVVVGYGSTFVTASRKAATGASTVANTTQQGTKTSAESASGGGGRTSTVLGISVTTADNVTSAVSSSTTAVPKTSSRSSGKSTQGSSSRGTISSQSSNNTSKPFYEW